MEAQKTPKIGKNLKQKEHSCSFEIIIPNLKLHYKAIMTKIIVLAQKQTFRECSHGLMFEAWSLVLEPFGKN